MVEYGGEVGGSFCFALLPLGSEVPQQFTAGNERYWELCESREQYSLSVHSAVQGTVDETELLSRLSWLPL